MTNKLFTLQYKEKTLTGEAVRTIHNISEFEIRGGVMTVYFSGNPSLIYLWCDLPSSQITEITLIEE